MLEMGMSAEQAAVMASEQAAGMARDNDGSTLSLQLTVTGCGTADNPRLPPTVPPAPAPAPDQIDCTNLEAVCVESDIATMRETRSIDALSQGCQCCIIANSDSESGPMDTCLHSLVPPVDFCVDPGGGMNNFAAATF